MKQKGNDCILRGQLQVNVGINKPTLVTEEPTPSLLAVTLPWLLAGAMEASWVTDAVIAVTPTEAHTTPYGENITFKMSIRIIFDQGDFRVWELYIRENWRPINVDCFDLLALSWFITEAMFFITSRKADCCREENKEGQVNHGNFRVCPPSVSHWGGPFQTSVCLPVWMVPQSSCMSGGPDCLSSGQFILSFPLIFLVCQRESDHLVISDHL